MFGDNSISPDKPFMLTVSMADLGNVKVAVIQTDGLGIPERIDVRCGHMVRIVETFKLNVGVTLDSSFYRKLPVLLAYRDHCNMLFRFKERKQPLTIEMMQSVNLLATEYSKLKQELIEAACLAAI